MKRLFSGLISLAVLVCAQDRDFLTPNEVEQVRLAQDPNDRLLLYIHFAKQRLDVANNYLAKDKPGRSIFIHNALEDYNKIIEAIDSVSDDALRDNKPIQKGMLAVVAAEKDFLAQLSKIDEEPPRDYDRYKFVLQEAMDATRDSRELSEADAQKRAADLTVQDAKDKKERDAVYSAKETAERKKSEKAAQDEQKKIPSLLKPGEKLPDHD
jgi:hypothetical protein